MNGIYFYASGKDLISQFQNMLKQRNGNNVKKSTLS